MPVDLEYFGVPAADYREVESRYRYVAAAAQTTFNGAYTVGFVDVFLNGGKLDPVVEFTATNGTNVVLTSACNGNEIVEIISRRQLSPTDIYSRSQVDSLMSNYYGITTNTGDAFVLSTTPSFTVLTDGMQVKARMSAANTTTTPTININGLGARTVLTYNQQPCTGGDWLANSEITFRYNQALDKWLVVEGMVTAITPSQFDNTAKLATTAFVQKNGIAPQNIVGVTANTTYTASQIAGACIVSSNSSAITITLPVASTMPGTAFFMLKNAGSQNVTVAPQGSDTLISMNGSSGSIIVQPADWTMFCMNGSAGYLVFGGSSQLNQSSMMNGTSWTTAAQFDNTAKLATTAFVQRALGSFTGTSVLTANTTLTSANAGQIIEAVNGITLTLPGLSGTVDGTTFTILNLGTTTVTITAAGTDKILSGLNTSGTATSYAIAPYSTISVVNRGGTTWMVSGAGDAPRILSSVSGYTRLPSGLIIQWGQNIPTTAGLTVSFPVTFPNGLFAVTTGKTTSSNNNVISAGNYTLSSFLFSVQNANEATSSVWIAVGF